MSIETLVKDAVDDFVQTVPHRPGLADIALRQARRRKHAVRTAVVGGTAIAVAAVIPFGTGLIDQPDGKRPVDREQTQAAVPGEQQPAAKTVTIDIEKLKQGAPPAVPWSKNGDVFVGDDPLTFTRETRELPQIHPVRGGRVILTYGAHEELFLLRDGGDRVRLDGRPAGWVSDVTVSADGRQVAWSTSDDAGGAKTMQVADVETGKITRQTRMPGYHVGGFVDDEQLLINKGTIGTDPGALATWNIRTNVITRWNGYGDAGRVLDVSRSGELAIVETWREPRGAERTSPDGRTSRGGIFEVCTVVVETASQRVLWKSCRDLESGETRDPGKPLAQEFSPAGRYVLASQKGKEIVADARSGEPVLTLQIDADIVHPVRWESDDSIVLTVWPDRNRVALVRCTVAGDCERASPVGKADQPIGEHEGYWPYAILR